MNNIKSIVFFIFLYIFSNQCVFSQNYNEYYLEFTSLSEVPEVYKRNNKISLYFKNTRLTDLVSKYDVEKFELSFPGGKDVLERVYTISCTEELVNEMYKFKDVIVNYEYILPVYPLYMPNDFGSGNFEQTELTFINAQQAWDITTGNPNVKIGNTESAYTNHEDLINKVINMTGSSLWAVHGTQVAVVAAGDTDNSAGIASIGFNTGIITNNNGYGALLPLANAGARAINMSWGGCTTNPNGGGTYAQTLINQVSEMGVVLIAAAGNGWASCGSFGPTAYYFPASFDNVISVTGIGHQNPANSTSPGLGNRKDILENYSINGGATQHGQIYTHQYNHLVDLNAPGMDIVLPRESGGQLVPNQYYKTHGSSFSSPMTMGVVGLMFDVNPCLYPKEVESVLKLASIKNDTIPLNLPYLNKIGSGRLNAFESVKISKDMHLPNGIVELNNKVVNKWKYVLKSNPFIIKMNNFRAIEESSLDFQASNYIEIENSDLNPQNSAFSDLKIKDYISCNNLSISNSTKEDNIRSKSSKKLDNDVDEIKLYPNPNNGIFSIVSNFENHELVKIEIYDLTGKRVFENSFIGSRYEFNLSYLKSGQYIVEMICNNIRKSLKFIKN